MNSLFISKTVAILFALTISSVAIAADKDLPKSSSSKPHPSNLYICQQCMKMMKSVRMVMGSSKLISILYSLPLLGQANPQPPATETDDGDTVSSLASRDPKTDQEQDCKIIILKKSDFDAYEDLHLVKKAARYNFFLALGAVAMVPLCGCLAGFALAAVLPSFYPSMAKPAQSLIFLALMGGSSYGFKKLWQGSHYYGYVEDFRNLAHQNNWTVKQGPGPRTLIQIVKDEQSKVL